MTLSIKSVVREATSFSYGNPNRQEDGSLSWERDYPVKLGRSTPYHIGLTFSAQGDREILSISYDETTRHAKNRSIEVSRARSDEGEFVWNPCEVIVPDADPASFGETRSQLPESDRLTGQLRTILEAAKKKAVPFSSPGDPQVRAGSHSLAAIVSDLNEMIFLFPIALFFVLMAIAAVTKNHH